MFFLRQRTTDNRNPPFVLRLLTGEAKDRCPLFHNSVFPAKPKPRGLRPVTMALTTRNPVSYDPKVWHLRPVTMGVLTQKYGTYNSKPWEFYPLRRGCKLGVRSSACRDGGYGCCQGGLQAVVYTAWIDNRFVQ